MAYASSSTFGSLKTKISKKLIDANQTAISNADVGDALNDALSYWKQKVFWFNTDQTTVTMGISNPYVLAYGASQPVERETGLPYTNPAPYLPQNFLYELDADGFVIYYTNLRYRFDKVNPKKLDDENDGGIGMPYMYCFRSGNYEFYWAPQLNYVMTVNFVKDYPAFVLDADINDFTKYADRLIMYEALSHLMGENRQDQTQENVFATAADREYRLLKQRSGSSVTSGNLDTTNIL